LAQTCAAPFSVNNTSCTVTPGTTIAVPAAGTGLTAAGGAGHITGDGITVNLNGAGATGASDSTGASIQFNGSTVKANVTGANANNQTGLRANGNGSSITANGSTINMVPASGTTNGMLGLAAEAGASVSASGTNVTMGGGGNGAGDHGLLSTGTGSQIAFTGGSVSAIARGSSGRSRKVAAQ
jgi:hypothetical protein